MRFTLFFSFLIASCFASEVEVTVTGISSAQGELACALFPGPKGFPMDASGARVQRQKAAPGTMVCRFSNLPAGAYAFSVAHDANSNGKTDTRMFGIPSEDWGVSNNVRPRMRAPRFEEARFEVAEGQTVRLQVAVGR